MTLPSSARISALMKPLLALVLAIGMLPGIAGAQAASAASSPLTVFAAASLKESLDEAAAAYQQASGHELRVSYAGSSALARQVEQGAPADAFISADLDWMDYLDKRGLIDPATRNNLLGNTLVLIAPASSRQSPIVLQPGVDLLPALGSGRIALALTSSVPAGKYAKSAFETLGIWNALQPRVAEAENVRAALLLVARGETPLGVVYGSDARADARVKVLATFPANTHPAIVYPIAKIKASRHPDAAGFIAWLQGDAASAIFRKHGFSLR